MSGLKLETITLRTPNQQIIANYDDIQANRELIELHYETDRVIAELGIHIIGTVATYEEIENTIPTAWGDAYAVGEPENYKFYIWTRRSPTTPLEEGQWLDLGKIAIQGPVGPSPVMGNDGVYITATNPHTGLVTHVIPLTSLKGDRGATWRSGTGTPNTIATDKEGDLYLNGTNGDVYKFIGGRWTLLTNIRGIQGNTGRTGPTPILSSDGLYIVSTDPQTDVSTNLVALSQITGPRGERGDPGAFIKIVGIVPNIGALPTSPFPESYNDAYLVGTAEPYDLYIQIGDGAEKNWQPMGPLNVATMVTVGGNYQNTWNADTKLDKDTSTTTYNQVYVKAANGGQGTINVTKQAIADAVVQRQSNGNIVINTDPTYITDGSYVVNKNYVDNKAAIKLIENTYGTEPKMYLYARQDKNDQAKKIIAPGSIRILATDNSASTDFTPSQIVNIVGSNAKFFDYPAASGTLATLGDLAAATNVKFLRQEIAANGTVNLLPNSLYMISVSGNNLNLVDGSTNLLSSGAQFMICFSADLGTAGPGKFAVMGMTYGGGLSINTFTIVATDGTTKIKNNNTSSTAGYNVMTKQ